ncbi:MAG TPA: FAD-binding oxidoreductase [Candidatus Dormibacteraeota bacterium]|nr:FAD-binding oxidoreductase [Candidatus Dormibacteraeota bacterium]
MLGRLREIVVAGAGIAGCTVAYELARAGFKVVLLEQRHVAWGASGRNLGLLLNDLAASSVEMMRMALNGYRELADGPVPFELREVSYLLLPFTDEQIAVTAERVEEMRACGIDCEPVGSDRLKDALPQLRPGAAGVHAVHGAWAVSPGAATRAYAEAARAAGADIRTGVRVDQLVVRGGRVEGVVTDRGIVSCDAVVVATGPWLTDLVDEAPLSTGRGWVLRTGHLDFQLPWVLVDMSWPDLGELGRSARSPRLGEIAAGGYDRPVAATVSMVSQPNGRALLGTSLAPSLREPVEGVEMPQLIARRALELLPGMEAVSVASAWYGLRPMTPDGLPIVGPTEVDGVFVHGGHGSIGMQSAPWTARALARIVQGGDAPEVAGFGIGRFGGLSREAP